MFGILGFMKQETIRHIQKTIFAWQKRHRRNDLPWRKKSDMNDLYRVMISEVMLQQTNVPKVKEKYSAFLERFPTVKALAHARQSEVIRAWQGLGYNRRALNLHKMAQIILDEFQGTFPETVDALMRLPGVGPYTAHAVLVFGRNRDLVARDVNVDRVLGRLCSRRPLAEQAQKKVAEDFLPTGQSRIWHEALMDFASMVCTKRRPQCKECPLKELCASYPCAGDFAKKKEEVGRREMGKHVPRRIYRGRIITLLRTQDATVQEIGVAIKKDWDGRRDKRWLQEILHTLGKEGFVMCTDKIWHLKK